MLPERKVLWFLSLMSEGQGEKNKTKFSFLSNSCRLQRDFVQSQIVAFHKKIIT